MSCSMGLVSDYVLWILMNVVNQSLRSAKTADKRILLFTNEDDPFGIFKGASKIDMTRTTLQRAKVHFF